MKTQIHINQHIIRSNKKKGKADPPITIKTYLANEYVSSVELNGKCRLVYSPDKPLSCGATVWIEFDDKECAIKTL